MGDVASSACSSCRPPPDPLLIMGIPRLRARVAKKVHVNNRSFDPTPCSSRVDSFHDGGVREPRDGSTVAGMGGFSVWYHRLLGWPGMYKYWLLSYSIVRIISGLRA